MLGYWKKNYLLFWALITVEHSFLSLTKIIAVVVHILFLLMIETKIKLTNHFKFKMVGAITDAHKKSVV